MSERAAAFLAAREQGNSAPKGKPTVRLGESALAIVERWRVGRQPNTVVVTRLLELADAVLGEVEQNGTGAHGRA